MLIYHPDGEFIDENTGERLNYAEYAISMGERMRSGGVIALPSEVYEDNNGRGTLRQWEMEFTSDATNFDPFDASFDYLDVQKLRSLWIPEQAFLEGKGGTSSRNVAHELGDSFVESQAVLAAQLVETINRWVIPQWLAVNYPEFITGGGSAEFIMQGFADEDIEFVKQVIQLIGQQDQGAMEILKLTDLKKVLQDAGMPIASVAEQTRRSQELAQAAQAALPPAVTGQAGPGGTVGVTQTPPQGTATAGTTTTGFAYYQPRESITVQLVESGNKFIDSLPDSPHYTDNAIRGHSRTLWRQFRKLYQQEYAEAISSIEEGPQVQTSEETEEEFRVEMASPIESAKRLLERWKTSKLADALRNANTTMRLIAKRASKLELNKANLSASVLDEEIQAFLDKHLDEVATKISETTHNEVQDFIAARISEGVTDRQELADLARDHFDGFPQWKTDRLIRTEVRDIYNAATLLAAEAAGVKQVQALDARLTLDTDADCVRRDGKIFSLAEAKKQDEHPNGTLAWRILPKVELSILRSDDVGPGMLGRYDGVTQTVLLAKGISDEDERHYLKILGDTLVPD